MYTLRFGGYFYCFDGVSLIGSFSISMLIDSKSSNLTGSEVDTPSTSSANVIFLLFLVFCSIILSVKAAIEWINISGLKKIVSNPVTIFTSSLNGGSDKISKIVSLRRGTRP